MSDPPAAAEPDPDPGRCRCLSGQGRGVPGGGPLRPANHRGRQPADRRAARSRDRPRGGRRAAPTKQTIGSLKRAGAATVVVTADVPLADRCVKRGAAVLGTHRSRLHAASIGADLAMRNLMSDLREQGVQSRGPKPFSRAAAVGFSAGARPNRGRGSSGGGPPEPAPACKKNLSLVAAQPMRQSTCFAAGREFPCRERGQASRRCSDGRGSICVEKLRGREPRTASRPARAVVASPGSMTELYHHPLCPHSRFVRLVLGEFGIEPTLDRGARLRAAARLPDAQPGRHDARAGRGARCRPSPAPGPIAEYLDETRGLGLGDRRLLPDDPAGRVEVRRLLDWFNVKFFNEVSELARHREGLQALHDRRPGRRRARHGRSCGRRAPTSATICAISAILIRGRNWLAGDRSDLCRSRGGGASVEHRFSGRRAMGGGRDGEGLVRAGEVAPVVPRRCWPTACRASCRARPTPTSISERRGRLRAPTGAGANSASMPAASRRPTPIPEAAGAAATAWLADGRARRHGLDGRDGATRRADPRALWPRGPQRSSCSA